MVSGAGYCRAALRDANGDVSRPYREGAIVAMPGTDAANMGFEHAPKDSDMPSIESKNSRLLDVAIELMKSRNYREAIALSKPFIAAPHAPNEFNRVLANSLFFQGMASQSRAGAVALYREAVSVFPEHRSAREQLAKLRVPAEPPREFAAPPEATSAVREHDVYEMILADRDPLTRARSRDVIALMDKIERPFVAPSWGAVLGFALRLRVIALPCFGIAFATFFSSFVIFFARQVLGYRNGLVDLARVVGIVAPIITAASLLYAAWRLLDLKKSQVGIHRGRLITTGGVGGGKNISHDLWLSKTVSVEQSFVNQLLSDGMLVINGGAQESLVAVGLSPIADLNRLAVDIRNFEVIARSHPLMPRGIFS